jgi:glycosyltransferase involved in cell wall biosynthesis
VTGAQEGRDLSLVIVGAYPEDPTVIRNGVEAVVVYLVEGLRRIAGIQIRVISTTDGVQSESVVERDGVTIYHLPSTRRLRNITFDAINKARVRRKIAELKPDVVHVHNHMASPYLGSGAPYPTVTTIHGLVFEEVKYAVAPRDWLRRVPRKQLEQMVLRRAQDVIAVSEYVRHAIQALTTARVTVIENPVAQPFFDIGATRLRQEPAPRVSSVLFAGAIIRLKNVLDLLRAVAAVRRDCPDIQLRLAGGVQDKAYYDVLQRYVHENALQSRVHFLGQLAEPELLTEYSRCSLIASASHVETAGMVFQQGMAAGVPILGTRVGGVPFIVQHDQTGLLVDPGEVNQLAAALSILLNNPGLRARLGAAARRVALDRFTTAIAAKRTMALYEQMIRRSATEARQLKL